MTMTIDPFFNDAESRMQKAVESLRKELATIRTGRSNPALVEHIAVDYYGVLTPLNQIASITAPEARLLLIQPWDKSVLPTIEKAILKSDLGLTPSSDGAVIRLALPLLTEQRRRELVHLIHKRVEESRIVIRNIRRNYNEKIRDRERAKNLSQDESQTAQDRIQKLTELFISRLDTLGKTKESEVLET